MIQVLKAQDRHFSDFGWLKTYWLFSFSDYYDPQNIQFGALRVFNDDIVQPQTGFPRHPHREMEIITIVLSGEITHSDSMGNKAVIRAGDVQRMSAGTGLTHSEYNLGREPVHFYQIWVYPDEPGLAPSYDQRHFEAEEWRGRLLPLASGRGLDGVVRFHTDATIYRADLARGQRIDFTPGECRRVFVYVTEGELCVQDTVLSSKDQARIDSEEVLPLLAQKDTQLILIDVPSCKGWGYSIDTLKGDQVRQRHADGPAQAAPRKETGHIDSRHCHRLNVELPVSFETPYQQEATSLAATLDISATGMSLITKERLDKGQELALRVGLNKGEPLTIHVEVVRVEDVNQLGHLGGLKEFKVGLKIVEPMQADEKLFVKYFAEQLKKNAALKKKP